MGYSREIFTEPAYGNAGGDKAVMGVSHLSGVLHLLPLPGEGSSVRGGCAVLETGKRRHPVTKAMVCPAAEFAGPWKPWQGKSQAG